MNKWFTLERQAFTEGARVHRLPGAAAAVLLAAALGGCGGGGGGGTAASSSASAPGAPTLTALSASDTQATATFTAPASNGGSAVTGYTLSCTGGGATRTATGTTTTITITGLTNAVAYSCSVVATNAVGTGVASSAQSVTPVAATASVTYAVPRNFASILTDSYSPSSSLSASTSLAHLGRYLVADATSVSTGTNFLSIGTGANPTYAATNTTLGSSTTYNDYFVKAVQAVVDSSDSTCFRLDSELHPIYSLDVDTSDSYKLKFRNNWGAATTAYGYLCFSYDSTTRLLQAKKRYTYSTTTYSHTVDASFPGTSTYYVKYASGTYSLVTSASSATALSLFTFPINVAIPSSFNPSSITAVSNARMTISSMVTDILAQMLGLAGKAYQSLSSLYTNQLTAAGGPDATATANAEAKLTAIKAAVEAQGGTLRYSVEVYKAFRNALLATRTASEGVANGTLGMSSAPYVYFTNETGSDGVTYHPFMVIASHSIADRPSRLLDIVRPPGESGVSYPSARVTRDSIAGLFLFKIPLRDYGQVSALTDNTMLKTLKSDIGSTATNDVYNYASINSVGVAVDGIEIYPTYNNTLVPSQAAGELTSNGNHVGQGMGIHYHADSQSGLGNELGLYNLRDYVGKTHPPLIGFTYDGVALFGRYVSSYSSMSGYGTELDTFGGHNHDGLGYHYHAHTANMTTTGGTPYVLSVLIKGAWAGKINSIPEFWDTVQGIPATSMSQRHKYVGKP